MKFAAAGVPLAALALLLAVASRQDPPPDRRAEAAEAELARFREIHSRLLERIGTRLDGLDGRLADDTAQRAAVIKRLDDLSSGLHGADGSLRGLRDAVAALRKSSAPDALALGRALLSPSVQVSARGGVGGGTILRSDPAEGTWVVTAWHVVQKAAERDAGGQERLHPVQVRIYRDDGNPAELVDADLVLRDERKDLALLKLKTTKTWTAAARLASRERMRETGVFTPIFAVGCPLGHDPLPTSGEITTRRKEVNGECFWMMSAPTIFGNSGGGVFHRETLEMIGVSAMVCTFENPVTTPVPHLGILVPMDRVYDWLEANGHGRILDSGLGRAPSAPPAAGAPARTKADW